MKTTLPSSIDVRFWCEGKGRERWPAQHNLPRLNLISIAIIAWLMNHSLGFLLNDTARLFRRAIDERARATGVTSVQWRMLAQVARNPGIRQIELADLLEVEPITVSRMIDRLADNKMIQRQPDPDDRRAWRIYLTEQAHPLVDDLRAFAAAIAAEAFRGLSADQLYQLEAMVEIIRSNLSRQKSQLGQEND